MGEAARRRTAAAVVSVLIVGAVVVALRAGRSSAAPHAVGGAQVAKPDSLLVEAVPVRCERLRETRSLSGQVEPFRVATIAAEVSERIANRSVRRGDGVAQGDVLAALNADSATAALSLAEHGLDQATAARRQAEADYARASVETDAVRQAARASVAQSIADLNRARSQVTVASAGERKVGSVTRRQELHQAEDALSQARTDERLSRIEFERERYLVREGASAQQALDRAQAAFDGAAARRQSAEQAVSLAVEGARVEDREAAGAQVAAAQSQSDAAAQQVEQARAALRTAETRDLRLTALRRQIDVLRAQERAAQDAVRQARISLEKRTIRAPFAGRILATPADNGDLVGPGSPVVRLGEISRVKVTFAVPEAARGRIRPGDVATITADALPGRSFTGRIIEPGFQADPRTRAFPIAVAVDNPKLALLPNMVARLELPVGRPTPRLLIPVSSVTGDGEQPAVFLLKGGRAERREVKLGEPRGGSVEVVKGLQAGDVIAGAPQRLSDGVAVSSVQRGTGTRGDR